LEGLLGAEQVRGSGPERITVLLRLSAMEANGKDTARENHCLALEPATETESESCISVGRGSCVREKLGKKEIEVGEEIATHSEKKSITVDMLTVS